MNYTQVITTMLTPEDKFTSVIDTFDTLCSILETFDRARGNKLVSSSQIEDIFYKSMYILNTYPYWQAEGMSLRSTIVRAMQQEQLPATQAFLIEAIPSALTFANPNIQKDYSDISKIVEQHFSN